MFISKLIFKNIINSTSLSARYYAKFQHPIRRTWNVITGSDKKKNESSPFYPEHADIVIIGGGYIGTAVAYWLKIRAGDGLSVVVLDKDLSYKNNQDLLSLNSITQHYSLPENILLSQYSLEFFRNIKELLGEDVKLNYRPHEHLLLASEKYAETLEKNVQMQRELGINNKLLSVDLIKERYPWLSTTDVTLGCISTEKEGVFNSSSLLKGLVQKSKSLGTTYVEAEVTGFESTIQRDMLMEGVAPGSFQRISHVIYKTEDNEEHYLKFAACIIAVGTEITNLAKLANIGTSKSKGLLEVALPIETRKYNVYSVKNIPNGTPLKLNTPYVTDTSGVWFRRNNLENSLISSQIPTFSNDENLSEEDHYNNIFKPSLLNRLPSYKDAEINVISNEMYDFNKYDDTGILGPHAYHTNLYFAAGFGRQGIQHAPGIGRAIAELIIDSHYVSIDLTRFGFDRLLMDEPLIETNIY